MSIRPILDVQGEGPAIHRVDGDGSDRRNLTEVIRALVERRPLVSYFLLTFAISWGVLLAVGFGPGGLSATPFQLQQALPYAVAAMLLGPGASSLLLTGLLDGRAGF
jgi:hypothetical protein